MKIIFYFLQDFLNITWAETRGEEAKEEKDGKDIESMWSLGEMKKVREMRCWYI